MYITHIKLMYVSAPKWLHMRTVSWSSIVAHAPNRCSSGNTTMRLVCVVELYATLAYIKDTGCCTTELLWQIQIAGNNKNVRCCIETKECSFANWLLWTYNLAIQIVMTDMSLHCFSVFVFPRNILRDRTELMFEAVSIKYYGCLCVSLP